MKAFVSAEADCCLTGPLFVCTHIPCLSALTLLVGGRFVGCGLGCHLLILFDELDELHEICEMCKTGGNLDVR